MDTKTLNVLEYPKVLERLAAHCDFSASAALARALEPTDSYDLAIMRQRETSEARLLLSNQDTGIGGARDVREAVQLARRGGVLEPAEFLDIKATLISCRELKKSLEKQAESYPRLAELALALPAPLGLVDAITRTISDKSEVLDSASQKLASLRSELRVAHDRLMSRLQKYLTDGKSAQMLQESLITQRDGRYVIPLRAEFKGQIKSIVHDQSSSGATLFVEPLAVVELNNKYREVQLAERDEVRRVLAELSTQVGMHAEELLNGVDALAEIDLVFAKAKYAEELHASEPILHGPKTADRRPKQSDGQSSTVHRQVVIRLDQARHPLLDPSKVVPIDVAPAADVRAVVITGPNTGGKTVSLKTVGLMVAMAQSGLHIPARSGSELSIFRDIYADIGDEQSIEQSLSTFSGHITNIIRILKKIDDRSLVIFDELGAGTDPQEGAALARAILAHLLERGVTAFVATHYPELKTYAHGTPGVVNASLEFDIATLRPTYKLTIGLPGRSNALAIASRLGLPEEIVSAAKATINPDELRADKLLDDIRKERNRTGREREKIEKSRHRNEELNRELEKRLAKIEDERREVIAKARAEAEMEVEVLKRNIESLKSQLKKARQPLEALKSIEEKMEKVEEKVQAPVVRKTADNGRSTVDGPRSPLALGEKVVLRTLGSQGVVTAIGENDVEVQVGTLRIRARLGDIQRKTEEEQTIDDGPKTTKKRKVVEESPSTVHRPSSFAASPGMELDLRGQRAEEALELLDNYLDRAFLAGMPFVRIIHGKGTGKLRQEVRAVLKDHPHVASFEEGGPKEGGDGVTVATLEK